MDVFTRFEIQVDILRLETILNCGIFNQEQFSHPLRQSAFTELMICLNDLLQKSKNEGLRIAFTDNVDITPDISDITDLVNTIRNAVCHIHSPSHMLTDTIKFTFNTAYGKGAVAKINDIVITSDFPDDIAFFFGKERIYMKRHIHRAFLEAKDKLLPLISQSP